MKNQNQNNEELAKLIDAMMEGRLSHEDDQQLATILENNPQLVAEYVSQINLHYLLQSELHTAKVETEELALLVGSSPDITMVENKNEIANRNLVQSKQVLHENRTKTLLWSMLSAGGIVAAVVALILLILFPLFPENDLPKNHFPPLAISPSSTTEVASLIDTEDAQWAEKTEAIPYGTRFEMGETLLLQEGTARIGFDNGVAVTLEGPAELHIISADRVQLIKGKLSASVPEPARGFQVVTKTMTIVDLGTRFGAMVDDNGKAEVHVFEGEVEVTPQASESKLPTLKLVTNEARKFEGRLAHSKPILIVPENFAKPPTPQQMDAARTGNLVAYSVVSKKKIVNTESELATSLNPLPINSVGDSFAYPLGGLSGQFGGIGFGGIPWRADDEFLNVITPVLPLSYGELTGGERAIQIAGRNPSYPAVANRFARELPTRLNQDFYFSFLARYDGLDEDDFFSLWFDDNDKRDATHNKFSPNFGIRNGKFFTRLTVHKEKLGPQAIDGETFLLVGHLSMNETTKQQTLSLWINPENKNPTPVAVVQGLNRKWNSHSMTIGLRMGQYTEWDDVLLLDRLLFGETFLQVTTPLLKK